MCNIRKLRPKIPDLPERVARMSAFEEHKEELERYEQMFGRERGGWPFPWTLD